jgi:glycosyltransferase involved in cell wall biosynthesis
MHYPIDFEAYISSFSQKDTLRKKLREQYNISGNEIVLSVVGKLVPWKNQDHIIDALILLEKEYIYMHLFIIGSGEMEEVWKKKAAALKKSKVHFTGFVNIDGLPAYYAATNVYVHPASWNLILWQ